MHELGPEGQGKLRRSKIVVVGLGGLGSAACQYLALAGVGHLRLVDQDTVEMRNLHRQVLYSLDDLRFPKVEAAAKRVKQINPDVSVEPTPENVRKGNVKEVIRGADCVVDGLDNFSTRYLINRICVEKRIPYIYASAIGIEGYLSVFNTPETPCLACVFPALDDQYLQSCETRGVLGATTGIIGTMEAMEAIKLLTGIGNTLMNTLLICDFYDMYITKIDIFKDLRCPVCGETKLKHRPEETERLVWLCGQDTANVNPRETSELSIDDMYTRLRRRFKVLLKTSLAIVLRHNDVEISLFKGGRTLIKNVRNEKEALDIYKLIAKHLEAKNH